MAHTVQTWTLIAKDRETTVLAGLEQCEFELSSLALCLVGHALALPNSTATEVLHVGRENDFEASLVEQFGHIVDEWLVGCTESLIEAGWEIYHALVL